MKRLTILCVLCFFISQILFGQVHIKAGYNSSITSGFSPSMELGIKSNTSLEFGVVGGNVSNNRSSASFFFNARFYFSPREKINDRFIGIYVSPYMKKYSIEFYPPNRTTTVETSEKIVGVGLGFMYGRKIRINKNTFFEFNFGLGRNFSKEVFLGSTIFYQPTFNPYFDIRGSFSIVIKL